MTNATSSPDYLPFDGNAYRLTMGLVALDPADWIEPDGDLTRDLIAKHALLTARHAETFAAEPDGLAGSAETLAMLVEYLPVRFPDRWRRDGDSLLVLPTGDRIAIHESDLHPLDRAGRLVQEDLCLMVRREAGWCLSAASLCAPARWRLSEKLGRPMAAIHAPVPGYTDRLAAPVDRFFDRLASGRGVWRVNWSVLDDPAPFQPTGHGLVDPTDLAPTAVGARLFLRVERQTVRRLPVSDAILFTIRTYIRPLGEAIRDRATAERLGRSIAAMPADVRAYKSVGRYADVIAEWARTQVTP